MKSFKILLAAGLLLLAPCLGNGLFAASGNGQTGNVYNWFFFVLTAFFMFAFLLVPVICSDALDESSDSNVGKIIVSLFFSAIVTVLVLMLINGIRSIFIFGLPSPVGPTIILLLAIVLFFSSELEITGNRLIDTSALSFGLFLVAFFIALGLKASFLAEFSNFSTRVYLLVSGGLFVVFRLVLWTLTR